MQTYSLSRALLGAALAMSAAATQAADFNFTGNLFYNTDRVNIAFDIASAADVKLWTDSWNGGVNFDPIAALWVKTGSDYTLVREVDDDSSIAPGQGSFDTGMAFSGLAAGHYLYTVGASFVEPFAKGTLLSQGYTQDGTTPVPITQWNQPSYDINANDQKGTFYGIRLSGVDTAVAVSAVPEPESFAMLLAGLCVVAGAKRRLTKAGTRSA